MDANDLERIRQQRHAERIRKHNERDALSLEISLDEFELIEFEHNQEMARISAATNDKSYELFQVTVGV